MAFIEAANEARRSARFFPLERDVLDAAFNLEETGRDKCNTCEYNKKSGGCPNLKKEGFDHLKCGAYQRAR